jgi:quinoprotein glucose dehydrogenase
MCEPKEEGTTPGSMGIPSAWGSVNTGGSIVTAGGLIFIGAAADTYLRAFDVATGAVRAGPQRAANV